jgi:hypothetical protein
MKPNGVLRRPPISTTETNMHADLVKLARKHLDGKSPHQAIEPFVRELTNKKNWNLLHAAALFVLQHVATQSIGQASNATHQTVADAGGASGHVPDGNQQGYAGGATPSKPKRKWTAPPSRTPEQRAGAVEVAKLVAKSAFETYRVGHQPIGNFRYRELSAMMAESATEAASTLNSGLKKTIDAVLFRRIREYARPPSDDTQVNDIVPRDKQSDMIREAEAEARQLVAYGVKGQRHVIEHPWEVLTNQTTIGAQQ